MNKTSCIFTHVCKGTQLLQTRVPGQSFATEQCGLLLNEQLLPSQRGFLKPSSYLAYCYWYVNIYSGSSCTPDSLCKLLNNNGKKHVLSLATGQAVGYQGIFSGLAAVRLQESFTVLITILNEIMDDGDPPLCSNLIDSHVLPLVAAISLAVPLIGMNQVYN